MSNAGIDRKPGLYLKDSKPRSRNNYAVQRAVWAPVMTMETIMSVD